MNKIKFFIFFQMILLSGFAQDNKTDTVVFGANHIVHKDQRVDLFGKKMSEYNESLALKIQLVNGYRLMLLNTTDRDLAMKVRSSLLQQFPDQKVYMTFQSPYIKLKIGNFIDNAEAEKFKKQIIDQKIVPGNIYLLNEKVEQKPTEKTVVPVEE